MLIRLAPLNILPTARWRLEQCSRTAYIQLSRFNVCGLGSNRVFKAVEYPVHYTQYYTQILELWQLELIESN